MKLLQQTLVDFLNRDSNTANNFWQTRVLIYFDLILCPKRLMTNHFQRRLFEDEKFIISGIKHRIKIIFCECHCELGSIYLPEI